MCVCARARALCVCARAHTRIWFAHLWCDDAPLLLFSLGCAALPDQFRTVALRAYACCPLLKLKVYPCHHVCHVCSVAKLRVCDFAPLCHTEATWRKQLGLSALPAPAAGGGQRELADNVRKQRCPLPDVAAVLSESPKGAHLQLVIAVRPGTCSACARALRASELSARCAPSHGLRPPSDLLVPPPSLCRASLCSLQSPDDHPRVPTRASAEARSARRPPNHFPRTSDARRTRLAVAGDRARAPPARLVGWTQTFPGTMLLLRSELRRLLRTGLRRNARRLSQVTTRSP